MKNTNKHFNVNNKICLSELSRRALFNELRNMGESCVSAFNELNAESSFGLYAFVENVEVRETKKLCSFIKEKSKESERRLMEGIAKAEVEFRFGGFSISVPVRMNIDEVQRLMGNFFSFAGFDFDLGTDIILCVCGDDIIFTK